MGLIDTLTRALVPSRGRRSDDAPSISFSDYLGMFSSFTYQGTGYPFIVGSNLGGKQEMPQQSFEGFIRTVYRTNGAVFAVQLVRLMLFSEARFLFRRRRNGRAGDLFSTDALAPLERPWTNAVTGDLLTRAIQDADLEGNFYAVRRGDQLRRLRPDWITIVIGSQSDPGDPAWAIDADVIGYLYQPLGGSADAAEVILPENLCHFAPIPDPLFRFRGMSWLTPVIREVMGDAAAMTHKLKFFENGATPQMIVSFDPKVTKDNYDAFVAKAKEQNTGVFNAYRTLYLGGGATATVVGKDLQQMDFKKVVGAGETRIAAAGGVPPVIAGLSEGLEASTYSNYTQARRRLADGTLRPLWRNFAGSIQHIIDMPPGRDVELWYDDRDIAFLREDVKDQAAIDELRARSMRLLVDAGFEPDTVVDAIDTSDMTRLVHTGLYSVQLQSPGSVKIPEQPPVIPGEPVYPELVAPSNRPGEDVIGAPPKQPALPAAPPKPAALAPGVGRSSLSRREIAIAERLVRGMTNRQIAEELALAEKTVENYVSGVLRKVGVRSRSEVTIEGIFAVA